jgi:hypothetical protein
MPCAWRAPRVSTKRNTAKRIACRASRAGLTMPRASLRATSVLSIQLVEMQAQFIVWIVHTEDLVEKDLHRVVLVPLEHLLILLRKVVLIVKKENIVVVRMMMMIVLNVRLVLVNLIKDKLRVYNVVQVNLMTLQVLLNANCV